MADMRSQLKIWEEEKVMPLVERGVKKVYTLLAGFLDGGASGKDKDVADICANLDWKRVFGLCLWFGEPVTASIADVFDSYESLVKNSGAKVARPFPPWYDQRQAKGTMQSTSLLSWCNSDNLQPCDPEDPLYALIRLHADPKLSLSHVLTTTSFGSGASHVDWSMCWHMYIILSRVMRVRDFGDREELHSRARSRPRLVNGIATENGEDEEYDGTEGHSPSADLLASSYAFQLETQGMLQEAVFVLLHIEGSVG
jgi:nuclear pore complex protein Nup98-Nup96